MARAAVRPADLATAAGAAATAGLGLVPAFGLAPIADPVILQTFGVVLCGLLFGVVRGAAAMLGVALLALAGLPVYVGFSVTPAELADEAGFLFGMAAAAALAGLLIGRTPPAAGAAARFRGCLGAGVAAVALLYLLGLGGMVVLGGEPAWTTLRDIAPAVRGDLLMAVAAAGVAAGLGRPRRSR